MSKIPLKTRKSIKEALEKTVPHVKRASEALGKELTLVNNTTELFEKFQGLGRGEDWLFQFGSHFLLYVEQFAKVIVEFCKNVENKEQLEAELTTGKFGCRCGDAPWVIEEGTVWMQSSEGNFGFYVASFTAEQLEKILGKTDAMPLNTRKGLKKVQPDIDKFMQESSKLYGKELSWVDNYQEIFDKLKADNRGEDFLADLGKHLVQYPKQLVEVFKQFCKDTDNKEALE